MELTTHSCRRLRSYIDSSGVANSGTRERAEWLGASEPMKNIAVGPGIAIGSVKTFALRAYRKLDALDRAEAVKRHRRLKDHACGRSALTTGSLR